MIENKSEIGHSMVEMLGVLAIMAVLTIGAVAGFQYAMDKYRANVTIQEMNQRAIIHSGQLLAEQPVNDTEFPSTTYQGYPVTTTPVIDTEGYPYFQITLEQVQGGVCHQILSSDWQWPALIRANGIEYEEDDSICRTDAGNRMEFIFPADLNGESGEFRKACQTDSDCVSVCGRCVDKRCESECGDGTSCVRTYDNASFFACCRHEDILNGVCCPSIVNGQCCASIGSCCPAEEPLMDKNGNCHTCDEDASVNVAGNTVMCNICDGKEGRTLRELNGSTCVLPCPDETPLLDSSGNCHTCDDDGRVNTVNQSKCDVCPNREWFGGLCAYPCEDGYFASSSGSPVCQPCTKVTSVAVTYMKDNGHCSTMCDGSSPEKPKRIRIGMSNGASQCVLETCPSDLPLRDTWGSCYACDVTFSVNLSTPSDCGLCPNRVLRGSSCATKCPTGTHAENGQCVCDGDNQFQDLYGVCYSCDTDTSVEVGQLMENCDVCGDARVVNKYGNGWIKCQKKCADDEYFTLQGCKKCSDPTIKYDEVWGNCSVCNYCDGNDGRAKRYCVSRGHYCALACEDGEVMAGDGTCHTCDDPDPFADLNSACKTSCAGQRYLVSSRCYKCPPDTYSTDSKACIACPSDRTTLTRAGDCLACGGVWDSDSCV